MAHFKFTAPPKELFNANKDTIKDLAIIGDNASLVKLFTMMKCPQAWRKFYHWLTTPVESVEIRKRQNAVDELKNKPSFILNLLYIASSNNSTLIQHEHFTRWLKNDLANYLSDRVYLLSLLSLTCFWGSVIAFLLNLGFIWILATTLLTNIILLLITHGYSKNILETTESFRNIINCIQNRADIVKRENFINERLTNLKKPLIDDCQGSIKTLSLIQKLMLMAELRNFGLIYLLAQVLFLWDIHVCRMIASWHKKNRTYILLSYDALSEIELLASIACFGKENTEFHYPKYNAMTRDICFSGLSHPLLSYCERISNDLSCNEHQPMLLISGSNMSGKSTFLKSVGLNLMIARLGAPICATSASLIDMNIETVIKVEDSIAHGESYFMAELKRIFRIVKSEKKHQMSRPTLCLFDEIMSGTNSEDRVSIFKSLANQLLKNNTIVLFSTHDNRLIESMEGNPALTFYQFHEEYYKVGQQLFLNFDYKMKIGVCSQTNAKLLLTVLNTNQYNKKGFSM